MKPEESFVGQPIRSLQTMLRTIAQVESGMLPPEADGVYANKTARSVAAFQRSRGLPVTGVADQKTWEAIVRAFEPARIETEKAQPIQIALNPGQTIEPGEANHILYLVQSMLITMAELVEGLPYPEHTGVLDPETQRIFLRRYWYNHSIKELAKTMHCSENRITGILFRTRKKLRNYLEKEGYRI